jgi:hypothetical protein
MKKKQIEMIVWNFRVPHIEIKVERDRQREKPTGSKLELRTPHAPPGKEGVAKINLTILRKLVSDHWTWLDASLKSRILRNVLTRVIHASKPFSCFFFILYLLKDKISHKQT